MKSGHKKIFFKQTMLYMFQTSCTLRCLLARKAKKKRLLLPSSRYVMKVTAYKELPVAMKKFKSFLVFAQKFCKPE